MPGKYSGKLQDLNADSTSLYLFYDTGEVSCYHIADQKTVYNIAAYPASEQAEYQNTSLVVKSADGFYQLRNGRKGGLFYFNSHKRTWKKLFEQNYTLNTLIITPNGEKAYISCVHGFWMIDSTQEHKNTSPYWKPETDRLSLPKSALSFKTDKEGYGSELSIGVYYIIPVHA